MSVTLIASRGGNGEVEAGKGSMVYLPRSSEEQPPTLMGPGLRGLRGMSRRHWEQLGEALGRELQTDGASGAAARKTPSLHPPWRKMILEGRLALTPSCFPFFLSCASLPDTSLVFRTDFRHHLLQEVFTDALSLGEVSFLNLPVTPISDSTAAVCFA